MPQYEAKNMVRFKQDMKYLMAKGDPKKVEEQTWKELVVVHGNTVAKKLSTAQVSLNQIANAVVKPIEGQVTWPITRMEKMEKLNDKIQTDAEFKNSLV